MKKAILGLCLITSSAFAGNYTVNGVSFKQGTIYTEYRVYQGDDSAACQVQLIFTGVSGSVSCDKLTLAGVAGFVGAGSLSNLLMGLGSRRWSNDETSGDTLSCKIWVDKIDTKLDGLCFSASDKQGNFSKK